MVLQLLGTGAADGWPNPFCRCASCTAERLAGHQRAQAAALVDQALLLDCAPSTPWAAERLGVSLADVEVLVWTHQHSDHFSPATLMYRSWVTDRPLVVAGPPDVVAAARHWLPPEAPVEFVALAPGDVLERAGFSITALAARHHTGLGDGAAAEALLYRVQGRSGLDLLYATDTGPLPQCTVTALSDACLDLLVLEESFGHRTDHGTDHLDLSTFPDQLRRLRAVGAITAGTRVVATHLSHHNPPTAELTRILADWGAEVVPDGTVLGPSSPARTPGPLRTLVVGGARSGKSLEAERILAEVAEVVYVATSYPVEPGGDAEWAERVRRHRAQRPARWETIETLDLVGLLSVPGPPLLVDCLTLWLTRVMDRHDAWDDAAWQAGAAERVDADVAALAEAWRTTSRRVVAVSNEVGQGVVPVDAGTRRFRDEMGRLNRAIAQVTEDVRFIVAGHLASGPRSGEVRGNGVRTP